MNEINNPFSPADKTVTPMFLMGADKFVFLIDNLLFYDEEDAVIGAISILNEYPMLPVDFIGETTNILSARKAYPFLLPFPGTEITFQALLIDGPTFKDLEEIESIEDEKERFKRLHELHEETGILFLSSNFYIKDNFKIMSVIEQEDNATQLVVVGTGINKSSLKPYLLLKFADGGEYEFDVVGAKALGLDIIDACSFATEDAFMLNFLRSNSFLEVENEDNFISAFRNYRETFYAEAEETNE